MTVFGGNHLEPATIAVLVAGVLATGGIAYYLRRFWKDDQFSPLALGLILSLLFAPHVTPIDLMLLALPLTLLAIRGRFLPLFLVLLLDFTILPYLAIPGWTFAVHVSMVGQLAILLGLVCDIHRGDDRESTTPFEYSPAILSDTTLAVD